MRDQLEAILIEREAFVSHVRDLDGLRISWPPFVSRSAWVEYSGIDAIGVFVKEVVEIGSEHLAGRDCCRHDLYSSLMDWGEIIGEERRMRRLIQSFTALKRLNGVQRFSMSERRRQPYGPHDIDGSPKVAHLV